MTLQNKIISFSKKKTLIILISCAFAILSTIVFCGSVIFSFILRELIMKISAVTMLLGLSVAFSAAIIFENKRNVFLQGDILDYLTIFSSKNLPKNYCYYEFISILYSVVRQNYIHGNIDSGKAAIANILNKILSEDSSNGLANSFVYKKPQAFSNLCADILQLYKNSEDYFDISNTIYGKYQDWKNCDEAEPRYLKIPSNHLIRYTKIALLLACILFYFYPDNSWIYNFTAIVVLAFEIFQNKKNP